VYTTSIGIFTRGSGYPAKYLKNTNLDCVKERLKLAQNGNKLVELGVGISATTGAGIMCLDDERIIYHNAFDEMIKNILKQKDGLKSNLDCIKRKLHQVEPLKIIFVKE
jgi:hypothetical protein